jgi:hypothetical protein
MHKIDLLKGQGLPPKTTLGSVFFVALMFVIPIFIAMGTIGFYIINKVEIDIRQDQIVRLKDEIAKSEPNVLKTKKLRKEKDFYAVRLSEVDKCVKTYIQWTPVLIALAENMTDNMLLNSLTVVLDENQSGVRKDNEPNKPLAIPIPQRKMTAAIGVYSNGNDLPNSIMREYQKKLKSEKSLQLLLLDIPFLKDTKKADDLSDLFTMNFILENQKK